MNDKILQQYLKEIKSELKELTKLLKIFVELFKDD